MYLPGVVIDYRILKDKLEDRDGKFDKVIICKV